MKFRILTLLLSAFLWTSCQTTTTPERPTPSQPRAAAPANEFRGAWVYDPRRFDPDDVVRELKDAGFNAVFVRLSSAGAAYYPSAVLPRAPGTHMDYAKAYANAGKKYGVKIHAWHVCFMMHHAPSVHVKRAIDKGEVMRDARGRALRPTYNVPVRTPALYSNRLLEEKAMVELVTKYALDGVQFDYIRYFSPGVDYSPAARAAFEKVLGRKVKRWPHEVTTGPLRDRYHRWKAELVTSVVRNTSRAVHAAKPGAKVSAAVWHSADVGYDDYGQDWVRWVREGYLDFVVPMNYTLEEGRLSEWIATQKRLIGGSIPLYAGIGSYMLSGSRQLSRQIDVCRQHQLKGFVLYSYDEDLITRYLSR
jgi:uncharacterized lipoprotein YddW (UPF0748 family)